MGCSAQKGTVTGAIMNVQAVILAAGMGTRLGKPWPKPLTPLVDGRTIMRQQMDNLEKAFGADLRVMTVIGFKLELIIEAFPNVAYVYNENYDQTNTNRSLLKALRQSTDGGVVWMNGDVVLDSKVLDRLQVSIENNQSCITVNRARVSDEEVKYTVDDAGFIRELSKSVVDGLGEAVGINYISEGDKPAFITRLREVGDQDYFERGLEVAIDMDGLKLLPVDISDLYAVEIDFDDDLAAANSAMNQHGKD
jgi:choline kinase